eukprot:gene1328-biopygen13839
MFSVGSGCVFGRVTESIAEMKARRQREEDHGAQHSVRRDGHITTCCVVAKTSNASTQGSLPWAATAATRILFASCPGADTRSACGD